jgi:hypothetical protein
MSFETLKKVEQEKYAKRLYFLHQQSPKISPEEIYLLLDPAKVESIAETQFARWAYRLESWRNGLILVPLLVTWLSLGLAAIAYVQTYQTNPDQPFLKQWADGFPGTTWPVPSFIAVAISDALLISIMLSLTIGSQMIESHAQKKAATLRSWLDDELYGMAAASEMRSLGAGTENKRPAWAMEVHDAINHLNTALRGVESLVSTSHDALKLLVSTSQTTFENLVQASQEKLEGSVRQFGGALRDQREAVEQFMSGTTEVRRAVDKLEKIYVEGENIYLGLNNTLPKIEGAFSTMATRQDNAASALESMSSKTDNATKAVGDIAQRFTQVGLVESTSLAARQMQQTAEAMRNIAVQMGNTVNQQIQLQNQLNQWANHMPSQSVNPPRKTGSLFSRLFHH